MKFNIRSFDEADMETIVQLSFEAWEPVFISFEHILGRRIFTRIYPDWQAGQREVVESVCKDGVKYSTYVAEVEGVVVGFIAYSVNLSQQTGEVELLAVRPNDQNQGIGTALNAFVLEKMRECGVKLVVVGTGGDPAHAPARRCYEKAGFTGLPLVRYYQDLTE